MYMFEEIKKVIGDSDKVIDFYEFFRYVISLLVETC